MTARTERPQKRAVGVTDHTIPGVDLVTPEEGRAIFDRQVESALGISGDEFLKRWDAVTTVRSRTLRKGGGLAG